MLEIGVASGASVLAAWVVTFSTQRMTSPVILAFVGAMVLTVSALRKRSRPIELRLGFLDRAAVITLTIGVVFAAWNGVRVGGYFTASDIFFMLAFLLALPTALGGSRPFSIPREIAVPPIAIVLIGLVGITFFGQPASSLLSITRIGVAMTLIPITIGIIGGLHGRVRLLADLWVMSAAISACVAIVDYFFTMKIGTTVTGVITSDRVAGLTTQENHLAVVSVLTIPIAVGRALTAESHSARSLHAASSVALALAVLVSGSRGGVVGLMLAVVITPLLLPRALRKRSGIGIGVCAVALLVVVSFALPPKSIVGIERITGNVGKADQVAASNRERQAARDEGIEKFKAHPVIGAGMDESRSAHNIFIQLLASAGILGLIAFGIYVFGYFVRSRVVARLPLLPLDVRTIAATSGISAITWMALGMVENQIADRYLFIPCGLVLATSMLPTQDQDDRVRRSRMRHRSRLLRPEMTVSRSARPSLAAGSKINRKGNE